MITAIDPKTALILVDLQKSIVERTLATPVSDVLQHAARLVEAFRKAGLPVVIVNVNPSGAAWLNTRKDAASPPSSPVKDGLTIAPAIKTRPDDVFITKHTWGAFYETALDNELKKRNITGIVLAGISTSIGVEGTARQASERGYNISFAKDAMTDMFAEAHAHSLKYIFPRIGETGDTDEIIAKMPWQA